jgi:RND family efflux transporter MFP subunit
MNKKGSVNIKFLVGIVVIIILLMQQSGVFSKEGIAPYHKEVSFELPMNYKLEKVEKKEINRFFSESGIVSTKLKANLSPQMMGIITNINVNEGDFVNEGDVLVEIASDIMNTKVGQVEKTILEATSGKQVANQQLLAAKAAFEQASKHYERMKEFYENSATTKVMLEDAEAKYKQAMAMVKSAEQGVKIADAGLLKAKSFLNEAKIGLSYTNILAPFSGIVTRKMKDAGDMAIPGHPILSLNNINDYRLEVNIRENLKDFVYLNQKLELEIQNKKFIGTVDEITPLVDPMTRTFTAKISFDPNDNDIFIGSYGKVLIPTTKEEIMVIPKESINKIGQLDMVLIKYENNAYRRYVKLGSFNDDNNVEIISGLSVGDTLIIKGE